MGPVGALIGKLATVGQVTVERHLIQNILMNAIQSILMDQNSKIWRSDKSNWLRTSCEIRECQLEDGNYFLQEHVPRDKKLSNEMIDDLLMNEKVWLGTNGDRSNH